MLTIEARRAGESVMVGDDVEIVVLSVIGTQVRLGINAPPNISIHREEIWLRIKSESQANRP